MIILLSVSALILRFLLAPLPSFGIDMSCWISWADHIKRVGPTNFYTTTWSDYLPSYLYILWFLGFIHQMLPQLSYEILLKLPAIFADVGIGWLIYLLVKKSGKSTAVSVVASSAFLFNPFSFFVSSVWGQVDSVFALCLLFAVYLIVIQTKDSGLIKYFPSIILAYTTLFKPQTLFFLPLLFVVWCRSKNRQTIITGVVLYIFAAYALALPFFPKDPFFGLPKLALKSSGTYPYASVNAMNLWGVFGNWSQDSVTVVGITKLHWGMLLLATVICFALYLEIKMYKRTKTTDVAVVLFSCSLIALAYFVLPTRVHERWLLPFFPLFAVVVGAVKDKKLWVLYGIMSLIFFLNLYYAYTYYNDNFIKLPWLTNFLSKHFGLFSAVSMLSLIYLLYYGLMTTQIQKNGLDNLFDVQKITKTKLWTLKKRDERKKNDFWNFFD